MSNVEGIGQVYRQKLAKVINASKGGITAEIASKALGVNRQEAGRLLSRWHRAGWLQRIKRGVYINIPVESAPEQLAIENPWPLISMMFSPGYFAGFSAIKHWNLSEQIFETTVFFTAKKVKDRHPKFGNVKVQLKTIKPSKIFATKSVWIGSTKVQVSDPSKTIIDLMDDPTVVGGMTVVKDIFDQYLESEHKNIQQLLNYAKQNGNSAVFKRIGFLLEIIGLADEQTLLNVREKISKGYSDLDPGIDNVRIIKKWNLKVPLSWAKAYDRKK